MSTSEKDYLLNTSTSPGKTAILKGVAVGVLVIGLQLALALSIAALVSSSSKTASSSHTDKEGNVPVETVLRLSSGPISAKVSTYMCIHIECSTKTQLK